MKSFKDRLAELERARWERLTPLERAYELIERQAPLEQWPDAELNAYCAAECRHLKCLTDAQVDALVACPTEEAAAAAYTEFTGQLWPA